MQHTRHFLNALGSSASNLASKAIPYIGDAITSFSSVLNRSGFKTEGLLDKALTSLSNQRIMDRPPGVGGDTSIRGYRTPDNGIFRQNTKPMSLSLFLPDKTPFAIGDEERQRKKKDKIPQYLRDEEKLRGQLYGKRKSPIKPEPIEKIERRIAQRAKKEERAKRKPKVPKAPKVKRVKKNGNQQFLVDI